MMTAAEFQCALDELGLDDEAASRALASVGVPMDARQVRSIRRGKNMPNAGLETAVSRLQVAADDLVDVLVDRFVATEQDEIDVYLSDEETAAQVPVPGVWSARWWRNIAAAVADEAGLRIVYPFEVSGDDGVEVASRASRSD